MAGAEVVQSKAQLTLLDESAHTKVDKVLYNLTSLFVDSSGPLANKEQASSRDHFPKEGSDDCGLRIPLFNVVSGRRERPRRVQTLPSTVSGLALPCKPWC